MARNLKLLVLLMATTGFITACSVQGDVTDETQRITIITAGTATGFVSSSKQGEATVRGYRVFSSSGNPLAPVTGNSLAEVTSGGYTVYKTVQGNNSSETVTVSIQ